MSTSAAADGCGAASVSSRSIVQNSGCFGSKMSARSASSFWSICRRGDDGRLLVARDFGLGLDDVDRRHGADFHARPVVACSVCRARSSDACATIRLKRAPTRFQYGFRTWRTVVTICCRSWTSEISRFFFCTSSCVRGAVDAWSPRSSGWVTLKLRVENEPRVEVREDVVRFPARGVPPDRVARARSAAPGRCRPVPNNCLLVQGVLRRRRTGCREPRPCCCEVHLTREVRRPTPCGLVDGEVLQLRIDALDLDVEVLLERQLHGLVERQLADGPATPLLLNRRRLRRGVPAAVSGAAWAGPGTARPAGAASVALAAPVAASVALAAGPAPAVRRWAPPVRKRTAAQRGRERRATLAGQAGTACASGKSPRDGR